MSAEERRQHARIAAKIEVRFSRPDQAAKALHAYSLNLSVGGLCVRTKRAYQSGDVPQLSVSVGGDRSMTVRVLVSAATPGALWDLRCELREKLMEYLNRLEDGRALPRARYDRISPFEQAAGGHVLPPS